jgi:hypothetical protein
MDAELLVKALQAVAGLGFAGGVVKWYLNRNALTANLISSSTILPVNNFANPNKIAISYGEHSVASLSTYTIVIKNGGTASLHGKDFVQHTRITVTNGRLLSIRLVDAVPEGNTLQIETNNDHAATLSFQLLNPMEYFVLTLGVC